MAFALGGAGWSGTDNAEDIAALGVRDDEKAALRRAANGEEAPLTRGMIWIRNRRRQRIEEDRCCFVE